MSHHNHEIEKNIDDSEHKKMNHKMTENGQHHDHHAIMEQDFKRRFFVSLVITVPILLLSPTIQSWFNFTIPRFTGYDTLLFALATVIALYGGWPFYKGAYRDIQQGMLGMMVLVSISVGTGYLFSVASTFILVDTVDFYWEISTLVVFLLFGHWMEMRMTRRATGALQELVKLIPPTANLFKDGEVVEIMTSQVKVGDVLLIHPGEKVPIDGVVIEGKSSLDESMITGESKPVLRDTGDEVIGGTINGLGSIKIRVDKTGEETALAQIIMLMEEVQDSKPPVQKLADRAATYLTITAITVGLGAFIYWNYFALSGIVFAVTTAVTVMVIACPHALGLAIPTVTAISTTLAAKNGILVKNADALEVGENIDTILFDKTGTLTSGSFNVTDVVVDGLSEDMVIYYAASLESLSEHPIGQALNAYAKNNGVALGQPMDFEAVAGHGVKGTVDGKLVIAGTLRLMNMNHLSISESIIVRGNQLSDEAKTLSYVAVDNNVVGIVAFADVLKDSSIQAIRELHALGKEIIMITGDNKQTAAVIAKQAGVDSYLAEVLPRDKAKEVQKLQAMGKRVAMVGDGINDGPALLQADIGIAIGAGTDVAIESADIVLIKNEPLDVLKLIRLSKATMRKMKENLLWAAGYNVIAIPVAAGILTPWGITLRPEWGALIMSASSIIVVTNALLLR
ncbi:copper-translocating P-type ATPase, partial [Candidatus Bathyarchaeota archaeon]|nr:copper-translocating P-type ATPase [Candidatus Bathyarchaeota archaeon]